MPNVVYTCMIDLKFDIDQFLVKAKSLPVIDVRSPVEFSHAHIPGAVNLPLFSNEERSLIGTLYLQKGSSEAMIKGLEIIGPKMKDFAQSGHRIASGGDALMYCWRGGMRSNSMAWLMNTVGIRTGILTGGYKTYRRYALEAFKKQLKLVVIGGMTGSGKTGIIEALESSGQQVLHIERLARHKGSVFGAMGMPEQPSTEQFENDLFNALSNIDPQKTIYVEDESLAIGKVFLPRALYDQMSCAPFVRVIVPVPRRIESLVASYAGGDKGPLCEGVRKIEKRLGLENAERAITCIQDGNMYEAVGIVLKYYDKIYLRSMGMHQRLSNTEIEVKSESMEEIAEKIVSLSY